MVSGRRVELGEQDVLVYKGMEIDLNVLNAIVDADSKRLLWAFVGGEHGLIQAVPYTEEEVIWMAESDILKAQDVEL